MQAKEVAMTPTDPTTSALDPPATAPPAPSNPTVDLLTEPTFEECVLEYTRYFEDRDANRISVRVAPEGHHVAYFAGAIHDHDADPAALRSRVAAALGVHPARIVVDYPWMW
jgi:hypothetical protein